MNESSDDFLHERAPTTPRQYVESFKTADCLKDSKLNHDGRNASLTPQATHFLDESPVAATLRGQPELELVAVVLEDRHHRRLQNGAPPHLDVGDVLVGRIGTDNRE